MDELVLIKTFDTKMEAEVLKGFLKSNGIEASILDEEEDGSVPLATQPSNSVSVMVYKQDYQRVLRLLI